MINVPSFHQFCSKKLDSLGFFFPIIINITTNNRIKMLWTFTNFKNFTFVPSQLQLIELVVLMNYINNIEPK